MKKKLIGAAVLLASLLPSIKVEATAQHHGYQNCDSLYDIAPRVCYDPTTGFGPVVLVYNASNVQIASWGVTPVVQAATPGVYYPEPDWFPTAIPHQVSAIGYANLVMDMTNNPSSFKCQNGPNPCILMTSAQVDILIWMSNISPLWVMN